MNDQPKQWAFVVFRITMGLNFIFHGVNRIYGGINNFRNWMTEQFDQTFLPHFLVDLFATTLPLFEILIGMLILTGLFTRHSLLCGGGLIAILMTGGCILGDWEMVSSQLIYAIVFFLLLSNVKFNTMAIDKIFEP